MIPFGEPRWLYVYEGLLLGIASVMLVVYLQRKARRNPKRLFYDPDAYLEQILLGEVPEFIPVRKGAHASAPPTRSKRRVAWGRVFNGLFRIVFLLTAAYGFLLCAMEFKGVTSFDAANRSLAMGDFAEAEKALRSILELSPDSPTLHYNLARVLLMENKVEPAIAEFHRLMKISPDNVDAHIQLGNALQAQNRPDLALAEYNLALKTSPKNAVAWNNIGNIQFKRNRLDDAIAAYRKAVAQDSHLTAAHLNLANALHRKGDLEPAIAECRWVVLQDRENVRALTNLASMLQQRGKGLDMVEATEIYRRTTEIDPNYAPGYFNLGQALQRAGDRAGAIQAYEKFIHIAQRHPEFPGSIDTALRTLTELKSQ